MLSSIDLAFVVPVHSLSAEIDQVPAVQSGDVHFLHRHRQLFLEADFEADVVFEDQNALVSVRGDVLRFESDT